MNRDSVISTLRAHEAALRDRGVVRAALFGSTARNEAGPASDIDVMVDIDPAANISLLGYVGIILFIEDLFTVPVDVAERDSLIPSVRLAADRDAVYAF